MERSSCIGSVNQQAYLNMLHSMMWFRLKNKSSWLQQDHWKWLEIVNQIWEHRDLQKRFLLQFRRNSPTYLKQMQETVADCGGIK